VKIGKMRLFWLIVPALAAVVLFLCLPLLLILRFSFNLFDPVEFMLPSVSVQNYFRFFTDRYYLDALLTTFIMAVIVTLTCLVMAFPIAISMVKLSPRLKFLVVLLIFLPLFVGNAVRAAGWMVAFGAGGLVNFILLELHIIHAPLEIMFSWFAVYIGIVSVNLPFVVLTLASVLENQDRNATMAALSLGAKPFTTWRLVTLPLSLPGLLTAGTLSFILTMNAYATPLLLGGANVRMIAPVIAAEVLGEANWPSGSAVSFALMSFTIILTVIVNGYLAKRFSHQNVNAN